MKQKIDIYQPMREKPRDIPEYYQDVRNGFKEKKEVRRSTSFRMPLGATEKLTGEFYPSPGYLGT